MAVLGVVGVTHVSSDKHSADDPGSHRFQLLYDALHRGCWRPLGSQHQQYPIALNSELQGIAHRNGRWSVDQHEVKARP
jgi:hypothetical protein